MGFNSTLVVLNDQLDSIRDDPQFGRKVHDACSRVIMSDEPIRIYPGAMAVETHHADGMLVIAVGGNTAKVLGYGGDWRCTPEDMVRSLADGLGFRLVRYPARRQRKGGR